MAEPSASINAQPIPPLSLQGAFDDAQSERITPDARAGERLEAMKRHKAETAHNLNMGGEDTARDAGIIATSTGTARGLADGSERRKKEERRRQLSDAALRASQRIAEIDRELAGLYEERNRILDDIRETERRMAALRGGIREIEENGDLERNEDGTLRSRALEEQLREYERRTGRSIDRNDPETLFLALRAQLEHEGGEMDHHRQREHENQSQIDRLGAERERHMDTIRREHPDATADELRTLIEGADNALSSHVRLEATQGSEMQLATIENLDSEFNEDFIEHEEGSLDDDSYFSFADEVDPDGAARTEPTDAPQQERAQPESYPDPFGPRMGG